MHLSSFRALVVGVAVLTSAQVASAGTPQTIDIFGSNVMLYGGGAGSVVATGGASGNPVRFSVPGYEFDCFVTDNFDNTATVTANKAGTCDVLANQAGDGVYDDAPQVLHSITIRPQTVVVTASTARAREYDGTTDATVEVTPTIAVSGVSFTATARFADANVGANKPVTISSVTLSGPDAGNYDVLTFPMSTTGTITKRVVIPEFNAASKMYDGTRAANGSCRVPTIGAQFVLCMYTSALYDTENVGTNKPVTVSGITFTNVLDEQNFTLSRDTASTTADITTIPLTVSGVVADKEYDGTRAATISSYIVSGVPAGETVSVIGGTATFASARAVSQEVTVSGYTVDPNGVGADRFSITNSSFTTTARITARPLSVNAAAQNKAYDSGQNAAVTLTTDALAGDSVSASHTSAQFISKDVGINKTVTVTGITLAGDAAANYTLTNTTAQTTASISQRAVTVTPTVANKVYDGSTNAQVTFAIDNKEGGDDVRISGSAVFADGSAGTGKSVTVSGVQLVGLDAHNYSATVAAANTAHITKAPLTVSFTASNKVFDGTTAATIATKSLAGVIGTDDVALSGGTAVFADNAVGTNKTVTATGFTLTGSAAGNYEITTVGTATANITAAPVVATPTPTPAPASSGGGGGGGGGGGIFSSLSCYITASPTSVAKAGDPVTLKLNASDGYTKMILDGVEYSSGSTVVVRPTTATTYRATLKGSTAYCSNTVGITAGGTSSVQVEPVQQGVVLGSSAFKFTRTLRFTMRGNDVKELQKILVAKKFLADDGNVTGYFGTATRAALIAFQKANNLEPVGYTGPLTRAVLNRGL